LCGFLGALKVQRDLAPEPHKWPLRIYLRSAHTTMQWIVILRDCCPEFNLFQSDYLLQIFLLLDFEVYF